MTYEASGLVAALVALAVAAALITIGFSNDPSDSVSVNIFAIISGLLAGAAVGTWLALSA